MGVDAKPRKDDLTGKELKPVYYRAVIQIKRVRGDEAHPYPQGRPLERIIDLDADHATLEPIQKGLKLMGVEIPADMMKAEAQGT